MSKGIYEAVKKANNQIQKGLEKKMKAEQMGGGAGLALISESPPKNRDTSGLSHNDKSTIRASDEGKPKRRRRIKESRLRS